MSDQEVTDRLSLLFDMLRWIIEDQSMPKAVRDRLGQKVLDATEQTLVLFV